VARTGSFSPTSRWSAAEVAGRAFGTARRGYDPKEVRDFLEQLAGELEAATRREQELHERLAAAEEAARHPVLDEAALSAALGQRSAAVLRSAHEEAARIAQQAEEAAATAVRDAQAHATEVQVGAESQAAARIAEAELEANALRQHAKEEAMAVLEAARAEGESLVERAREHGRAMVDQAQEARRRVLADMAQRRRGMTEQIDQFRAARDEIAGSVMGVRRSLDRIVDDLGRADDAARAAAAQAAHAAHADAAPAAEGALVEEAERAAAELGTPTGALDEVVVAPRDTRGATRSAGLRFDDIATVVSPSPEPAVGEVTAQGDASSISGPDELPPAPAADPNEPGAAAESASGHDTVSEVEELFARLRARHTDAETPDEDAGSPAEPDETLVPGGAGKGADAPTLGADAPTLGADAPTLGAEDSAAPRATEHAPVTEHLPAEDSVPEVDAAPVADALPVVEASPVAAARGGDDPGADAEPASASPDAAALAARDEALGPIVPAMARRLKRALQDDQNRLLDRLRQGTGEWNDDLLAEEDAQRALYAKAAASGVRDAIAAGNALARSLSGGRQPKSSSPDPRTVDVIADDLAATIVALLRRRLEGAEIPDAAERIGAAYREWRGERIERLTEDRAIEAFDAGVLAGAARSKGLRWVRSESGPGCADCEDNALAGDVPMGEEFPTGHRYPPAHPGCRCLVVPTAS
jgi:DivIVA domain-containing protein